jgi:heme a synthase
VKITIKFLASTALILAFLVLVLGAYTRLTDAGLGCPDWPGCYGHMVLPHSNQDLAKAQMNYPLVPIERVKAWTEMTHRYLAGTLGLFIFVLTALCMARYIKGEDTPFKAALVLLGLLFFQAILGMWTVTLKLLPIVVMGHLLGGMTIFAMLCVFRLRLTHKKMQLRPWVLLGVLIVFCQIALGGWVSSNYAGIACVGFPMCNGMLLPHLDLSNAFNLFSSMGVNHQGGMLDSSARVTIQVIHRLGALLTTIYLIGLSFSLIRKNSHPTTVRKTYVVMLLVLIQVSLGIINVVNFLPLPIAVAHNGVAALLLAALITLSFKGDKELCHDR